MCDIWKSFVAQRCLWELGLGVAFHSAEVYQDRNKHDLTADFIQEIPGYENNKRIADILASTSLVSGEACVGSNLFKCYEALVSHGIFPGKELPLVEAWVMQVEEFSNSHVPHQ